MAPTVAQGRVLYKALMKEASQIGNYNYRNHAQRLIKFHFDEVASLTTAQQQEKYDWGLKQVDKVRRIKVLSELYPASEKSIMHSTDELGAIKRP